MAAHVYIGCPVWAHAPWVGRFFTTEARREDFLPQYASVFETAEGNATFYGLPLAETVRRWAEEAPESFRFCLKFPRTISHDAQFVGAGAGDGDETRRFFERVTPLAEAGKLGPSFLQLHQSFDARRLGVLREFLDAVPKEFSYAWMCGTRIFMTKARRRRRLMACWASAGWIA